jgi:nicotinamidase/pyrazinamidase
MSVLLVVDVQNDFCPGGALPVKEGDKIIPLINQLRPGFTQVILTQDWHPMNHLSFAANHPGKKIGEVVDLDGLPQILWPVHCVQGSPGAQFHPDLLIQPGDRIFKKGTDPRIDSYSAFHDNAHRKSTGLGDYLRAIATREITICGLATDYCVKYSVLDALAEDFRVNILIGASRGVNLNPGDTDRAIEEMKAHGARLARATAVG